MELREQFTLASGVSQSMTPFKSKAPAASPTSSISGEGRNGLPTSGPITKVRIVTNPASARMPLLYSSR